MFALYKVGATERKVHGLVEREEVGCVCRGGGSCGPGVSAPIDITVVGAHDSRQDFVASDETCISYYVIQWALFRLS